MLWRFALGRFISCISSMIRPFILIRILFASISKASVSFPSIRIFRGIAPEFKPTFCQRPSSKTLFSFFKNEYYKIYLLVISNLSPQ